MVEAILIAIVLAAMMTLFVLPITFIANSIPKIDLSDPGIRYHINHPVFDDNGKQKKLKLSWLTHEQIMKIYE